MQHFGHLAPETRKALFHQEPVEFTADSPARTLAVALGATLYSPATRPSLAADVLKQAGRGVLSMVLCLEDSIGDGDVEAGEENLVRQLGLLDEAAAAGTGLPLLFVRVRTPVKYRTWCAAWEAPSTDCLDLYFRNSPRNVASPSLRR